MGISVGDLSGMGSAFNFGSTVVDGITKFFTKDERMKDKQIEAVKFVQGLVEERDNTLIGAQRDIIVAEMNQGDNYTKRARPSIIYVGLGAVVLTNIFIPVLSVLLAITIPNIQPDTITQLESLQELALPDAFWLAWTGVASAWVLGRSAEKRGSTNKVIQMITGNKG